MRTYYLLLLWLIATNLKGSTCCEFPLMYLMVTHDAPTEEALAQCLLNTTCTDKRYFYAGKMINAYESDHKDSIDYYFDEFILHTLDTEDELSLKIIYIYASYLELRGLSSYALPYYIYINNKSKSPTLSLLSSIGISGISKSQKQIESYSDTLLNVFAIPDLYSPDEKMAIIIRLQYYLPPQASYQLLSKHKELYKKSKNSSIIFFFLSQLEFFFAQSNDEEYKLIWNEFEKSYSFVDKQKFKEVWHTILSRKELSYNRYDKSLEHAKKALEICIGDFKTHAQLMEKIQNLNLIYNEHLERYAQNKLYQTRLKKGITPVIEAFQIYSKCFVKQLQREITTSSSISADKATYTDITYPNILIVGTYLYQQTGDLRYLNESISIMDGFAGAGSNYWTQVRALMRQDAGFTGAIQREREITASLREPAPDISLVELRGQHRALEAHRQSMRDDYPQLYNQLTEGYELDLTELREELTADSSGLVAFYLTEQILYRLYVAADTIEILPMNNVRREVLALTAELSELVANGRPAPEVSAPSQRLYQLLFAGIDELLPARLHLVAGGELDDIPFAALRRDTAAGPPRYLGMECALSRQFSIRAMELLEEIRTRPGYHQPLALAPSFEGNLLQASELRQAGFKLPPLLYNGEELSKLETKGAGKYLYGKAATAAAYKAYAPDYGIIHLATHAISSQADGLRSSIYLLDDAGEPTSLYASEIGEQTLNADLVVLSACETGTGGRHANEGRIGLTKAYLAAGARTVVASHWAVDDHATAELMDGFYQALETGAPPHEALQTSRRAYLAKYPEAAPYKWAAFGAYGSMETVKWDRNANGRTGLLFIIAGLFAAAGAGYAIYRKKQRAA